VGLFEIVRIVFLKEDEGDVGIDGGVVNVGTLLLAIVQRRSPNCQIDKSTGCLIKVTCQVCAPFAEANELPNTGPAVKTEKRCGGVALIRSDTPPPKSCMLRNKETRICNTVLFNPIQLFLM
jgi:hypothetical protein